MVEHVESLHSDLEAEAFRQLCALHERQIHLPDIQGTSDTVRSVPESSEISVAVGWWRVAGSTWFAPPRFAPSRR
jgi:hypothetical protein